MFVSILSVVITLVFLSFIFFFTKYHPNIHFVLYCDENSYEKFISRWKIALFDSKITNLDEQQDYNRLSDNIKKYEQLYKKYYIKIKDYKRSLIITFTVTIILIYILYIVLFLMLPNNIYSYSMLAVSTIGTFVITFINYKFHSFDERYKFSIKDCNNNDIDLITANNEISEHIETLEELIAFCKPLGIQNFIKILISYLLLIVVFAVHTVPNWQMLSIENIVDFYEKLYNNSLEKNYIHTQDTSKITKDKDENQDVVYINIMSNVINNDKKYHKENCSIIAFFSDSSDYIESMFIDEAKRKGYTPCEKCFK